MHLPYIPERFYKTPGAILGYEWDWSRWLTGRGDTIASAEVTCADLDITEVSHTNGIVTATVGGGEVGSRYTVNCKITTTGLSDAGVLVNDRSILITIKNM